MNIDDLRQMTKDELLGVIVMLDGALHASAKDKRRLRRKLDVAIKRPIAYDGAPIYEGDLLDWNGEVGECVGLEFSKGRAMVLFKHMDEYGDVDWPNPKALRHVKTAKELRR